jgi:hypothetical protein
MQFKSFKIVKISKLKNMSDDQNYIFSNKFFVLFFSVRSTFLWEKGRNRIRACDKRIRMRIREAQKPPEHWTKPKESGVDHTMAGSN